jgi:hypothetical protein
LPKFKVRRGDNPHVHLSYTIAANPLELFLLKNTQQFCLQFLRHVANLIEEQCSTVRSEEFARSLYHRSGKSTSFMAK